MTAPLGGSAGIMQIGQGFIGGFTSILQSKQVEANAKVMAKDMKNRKQAMLAARLANSQREANITSHKLADIESAYSVSGIEMGGDIANYVAEVAAVEEMNTQQLNQNAYYTAAVMDVQRENMQMQAKQKSRALKIGAIAGMFGASFEAAEIYSENASYWDNYGPGTNSEFGAGVKQDAFRGGFLE